MSGTTQDPFACRSPGAPKGNDGQLWERSKAAPRDFRVESDKYFDPSTTETQAQTHVAALKQTD